MNRIGYTFLLLFFWLSAFGQLDQFRMVGTGTWSTINDSTYSAVVTFASDLTGNFFLPTGITDTMKVFSQTGQRYTIDSVGSATFSFVFLRIVEDGGDWRAPVGQVMVYEDLGQDGVPAIPFATNGATSKLQEAIVTRNNDTRVTLSKNRWSASIDYQQNDLVNYAGDQYRLSAATSTGERPDTSGNWTRVTVENASPERRFQTFGDFEAKKNAVSIEGQEVIDLPGENLFLNTAPPKLYRTGDDSAELTVDGFFLDTVNVNFDGENKLRFSRYLLNYPVEGDAPVAFNGKFLRNFAVGPDGKRMATGITNASGQTMFLDVVDVQTNTDYLLSFYVKIHNVSNQISITNSAFNGASFAPTVTIDTSRRDWVRYTVDLEQVGATPIYVTLRFNGISNTDTVVVDMFQLEEEPTDGQPTAYKETAYGEVAASGKMYVSRAASWVKDGVLEIPQGLTYNIFRRTGDDTDFLQNAVNFCANGNRCNVIQLPPGHFTTTRPITGKGGVIIRGKVEYRFPLGSISSKDRVAYGTVIYANLSDSTQNAFNFVPAAGDQNLNSSGLENIQIVVIDTIQSVLNIEECTSCVFRNISIESDGVGKFNKGMVIETNAGSDVYWNEFVNLRVNNADSVGVEYHGSTNNYWRNIAVVMSSTDAGSCFRVAGGNHLYGEDFLFQNSGTALLMDGGVGSNVHIKGLYTEGSGGGSGVIKMTGGTLKLTDATLQTGSSTDTLFNVTGGEYLAIEDAEIRIDGVYSISGIKKMHFNRVGTTEPLSQKRLPQSIQDIFSIKDNYNRLTGVLYDQRETFNEAYIENVYRSGSINETISDTLYIANTILKGYNVNYVARSDSFLVGVFGSSGLDSIRVKNSGVTGPFGGPVKTIVYDGADMASTTNWFTASSTALGASTEYYTFSVYLYNHSSERKSTNLLTVRPGSADNDASLVVNLPPQQWVRQKVTAPYVTDTGGLTLRLARMGGNLLAGDSISIAHMKIEPGHLLTTYTETTGTAIVNDSLKTTIAGTGHWKITGDVQIDGELRDSDNDAGTSSQVLSSTGSGTNWVVLSGSNIASTGDSATVQLEITGLDSRLDAVETNYTSGSASGITDLSGNVSITHNLGATPTVVLITGDDGNPRIYHVTSKGATTFGVNVNDATGADVISGAYAFDWIAIK